MKLRKLENSDLPLVEKWLNNSHVAAFLGDAEGWMEEIKTNMGEAWISYFIVEDGDRPVGFAQYYETDRAPVGIWTQAPRFSLGIDYFVGEEEDQGKGYGTKIVALLKKKLSWEKLCKFIVADPDPHNKSSIRVLEKNGFILKPNGLYQVEADNT